MNLDDFHKDFEIKIMFFYLLPTKNRGWQVGRSSRQLALENWITSRFVEYLPVNNPLNIQFNQPNFCFFHCFSTFLKVEAILVFHGFFTHGVLMGSPTVCLRKFELVAGLMKGNQWFS